MKKQVFLFVIMMAAVGLHAQQYIRFHSDAAQGLSVKKSTSTNLSLHYSIQELGIANIDNGEEKGQEIILKGSFGSFAAGLPNLPSENRYVAVPRGATVSVQVNENGSSILNGIDLADA